MSTVEERLSRIESNQAMTNETLNKIHTALCGNPEFKLEGVVEKVDKHDKYIETDKRLKWMIAGGVVVISAIVTIIIKAL